MFVLSPSLSLSMVSRTVLLGCVLVAVLMTLTGTVGAPPAVTRLQFGTTPLYESIFADEDASVGLPQTVTRNGTFTIATGDCSGSCGASCRCHYSGRIGDCVSSSTSRIDCYDYIVSGCILNDAGNRSPIEGARLKEALYAQRYSTRDGTCTQVSQFRCC